MNADWVFPAGVPNSCLKGLTVDCTGDAELVLDPSSGTDISRMIARCRMTDFVAELQLRIFFYHGCW